MRSGYVTVVLASLLASVFLAGCSGGGVGDDREKIQVSFDHFTDAAVDVGFSVVHAVTLETLHNQSSLGLTMPFSAYCAFPPGPVTINVSVKFHLLPGAALWSGSTPAGSVLVDGTAKFTNYALPLFVVDDPLSASPQIVDVLSIDGQDSMTLKAPFTATSYYLYQTRQLSGTITSTTSGLILPVFFCDNTAATTQLTTVY